MSSPALRIEGVTKLFGSTVALADTSFGLGKGEFVSLLGPSGCGKSTLFNVIAGLTEPTKGRVAIADEDVTGRCGHVGYMMQKDLLLPWKTVRENIVLGATLTGSADRADREEAAVLAERYGLGGFIDQYPHTLSGGMRQRVALMRTLAFHKEVILLDEPFGALDALTRADMHEWLLEVWEREECTVLFVTHDVDEALFLSDRILVMSPRPGRIETEVRVEIPRPRSVDAMTSRPFVEGKARILATLRDARAAMAGGQREGVAE
ncbi:MAG: ABC transporter ATP-binding protein [Solirubrobacterales bacterium]